MIDEQLLSELKNGQEDAFRKLVEGHQHNVINICYRFVNDKNEAEDLAQETFIEIHKSIGKFRGQSSLSTWIHRIAVTKSLDYVRKQQRQKRGGKLKMFLRIGEDAIDIPAPSSKQPDSIIEQNERRDILNAALSKLPKKQHVAFVLSKYDGLSNKEVAKTMKLSVSSVESLIHRAKSKLQQLLKVFYEKD